MQDCKGVNASMISSPILLKNLNSATDKELVKQYWSYIGTQIWAYIYTRPELGFSVLTLSRFSSNPTAKHFSTVKRVYKYLQGTKDYKLVYLGDYQDHIKLEMYMDADWACNMKTRRSTISYVTLLNRTAIF